MQSTEKYILKRSGKKDFISAVLKKYLTKHGFVSAFWELVGTTFTVFVGIESPRLPPCDQIFATHLSFITINKIIRPEIVIVSTKALVSGFQLNHDMLNI